MSIGPSNPCAHLVCVDRWFLFPISLWNVSPLCDVPFAVVATEPLVSFVSKLLVSFFIAPTTRLAVPLGVLRWHAAELTMLSGAEGHGGHPSLIHLLVILCGRE